MRSVHLHRRAILLLLATLGLPAIASGSGTASIEGLVVNEAGQPVPDADVEVTHGAEVSAQTTTGADGRFRMQVVAPDTVTVMCTIRHESFGSARRNVYIRKGSGSLPKVTLKNQHGATLAKPTAKHISSGGVLVVESLLRAITKEFQITEFQLAAVLSLNDAPHCANPTPSVRFTFERAASVSRDDKEITVSINDESGDYQISGKWEEDKCLGARKLLVSLPHHDVIAAGESLKVRVELPKSIALTKPGGGTTTASFEVVQVRANNLTTKVSSPALPLAAASDMWISSLP